jgi:hypothetical protein
MVDPTPRWGGFPSSEHVTRCGVEPWRGLSRDETRAKFPVQNILVYEHGVRARYRWSILPTRFGPLNAQGRPTLTLTRTRLRYQSRGGRPLVITDYGVSHIGTIQVLPDDPYIALAHQSSTVPWNTITWRYDYLAIIAAIEAIRAVHGPVPVDWNLRGPKIETRSDLEWAVATGESP